MPAGSGQGAGGGGDRPNLPGRADLAAPQPLLPELPPLPPGATALEWGDDLAGEGHALPEAHSCPLPRPPSPHRVHGLLLLQGLGMFDGLRLFLIFPEHPAEG